MPDPDFTLDSVESDLGVGQRFGAVVGNPPDVEPPGWLVALLARGQALARLSAKARSEFIVAPTLLAVRELSGDRVSILSGARLDVEPPRLVGECDFLLSLAPPLPRLRSPLVAILGAKRNDIAGLPAGPVFGCVTTGEAWQFLRLDGHELVIDPARCYIDRLGSILAALLAAVGPVGAG